MGTTPTYNAGRRLPLPLPLRRPRKIEILECMLNVNADNSSVLIYLWCGLSFPPTGAVFRLADHCFRPIPNKQGDARATWRGVAISLMAGHREEWGGEEKWYVEVGPLSKNTRRSPASPPLIWF